VAKSTGQVIPVAIEDEVRESYLNYAMSVIVSRALPDVRDGLKPVHRRILYAMDEMGLRHDRPYKKVGRVVGDVLGKYHPHGDQSIYDALVRLAQDFSMRYPVVDGQGNFGSVDGDPPAAMRYTEARMARLAEVMLRDINKETVDFRANYDDSMQEPVVLPGALPFLLVNGGSGIAVGMATNLPPHNLVEIANAIVAVIEKPKLSFKELCGIVRGPDFPTGGMIFGTQGILDAYKTGRGKIVVRARINLETAKSGRDRLIVTEIPYQVNKANLIVRIADLVKNRKIDGISDLRDESDRNGMRIVIELRRGAIPKVVLNQLFTHTQLQLNFGVINLALVHGRPKELSLREIIDHFIDHRKEVVTRRTKYELRKAEERAHILEGLKIALENIDEVVAIIKKSQNVDTARRNLMRRFELSELQAQAILDMRLQKLTSLETKKILDELREILEKIKFYKSLLASEKKILGVVKEETQELAKTYGDERRTEIMAEEVQEFNIEDLIAKEDMVILISNKSLIKRVPVSAYRRQGRGGKGSSSARLTDTDFVEHLFIASTHDYIMFVTSEGKAYWLKVHEIPEASRASRGQSVKTLLSISNNEEIADVVSLKDFSEDRYFFMMTLKGIVKKVQTSDFSNARTRGIVAIKLDKGDRLISAMLTGGKDDVIAVTRQGLALRFTENSVRPMGRASRGVIGIRLSREDEVAGLAAVRKGSELFLITEHGYGKRIEFDNFSTHGRGTRGQTCYKVSKKTGELVGVLTVQKKDDLVCITSQGNTIKLRLKEIPVLGKAAIGVHIVNIEKPDMLVAVARAAKES
jgi:DNA gyrase subunit A